MGMKFNPLTGNFDIDSSGVTVTEIDGAPSVKTKTIKFTNGSVTDNGDGTVSVATGAGGGGDFSGPASSTDNAIVRFDGAGGKTGQNSGVTINDANGISTTVADTGNTVGLTVTQNDVTNNPIGLRVNNTAASVALFVDNNNTNSGFYAVQIDDEDTHNNGAALGINSPRRGIYLVPEGTGTGASDVGIMVDQGAGLAPMMLLDRDTTNSNISTASLDIDATSVVDDAATYTKSGSVVSITSDVTETSGTITDTAIVLDINQTHADASGNVVDILNSGTGNSIEVDANGNVGTAVATDGAIHIENTGNTGIGLGVYSNIGATADAPLVKIHSDNTAFDQHTMHIVDDGTTATAAALRIDQTGALVAGSATSGKKPAISIVNTLDNSDSIYINQNGTSGGVGLYIDNYGTEDAVAIFQHSLLDATEYVMKITNEVAQTNSEMIRISNDQASTQPILNLVNTAGSGHVLRIDNDGTGAAILIDQDGVTGTAAPGAALGIDNTTNTRTGLYVYSNTGASLAPLVRLRADNTSYDQTNVSIENDGSGKALFVDNNGNGIGIDIDHDGNSASAITGLNIDVANAGAGAAQAINIAAGKLTGTWDFSVDPTVPDEAYGAGWNDSLEVPTKNALYDKIDTMIVDSAYAGSWNGDSSAPTKNAIWDKMETMAPLASPTFTGTVVLPSGTVTDAMIASSADVLLDSKGITIDGGGAVITTGLKGYLEIPYNCTITQVTMLADQSGSAVVDIWKDTYANYPPTDADTITAAAPPTISTATKSKDTTLTGWTTTLSAGDILGFNVDSATTIQRLHVSLTLKRT